MKVARNNAFVIIQDAEASFRLLDGHSNELATTTSLAEAIIKADDFL